MKLRKRLPKGFEWERVPAIKEKKKDRAKGGIIIAISTKLKRREIVKWSNRVIEIRFENNGKS